jgi:hypothetical protein
MSRWYSTSCQVFQVFCSNSCTLDSQAAIIWQCRSSSSLTCVLVCNVLYVPPEREIKRGPIWWPRRACNGTSSPTPFVWKLLIQEVGHYVGVLWSGSILLEEVYLWYLRHWVILMHVQLCCCYYCLLQRWMAQSWIRSWCTLGPIHLLWDHHVHIP